MPNPVSPDIDAPSFVRRSTFSEQLGVRVVNDGPVNHLTADSLERPLEMPKSERRKAYYIAAIAAVLSLLVLAYYNFNVFSDRQAMAESVEDVLNRGVTLDLPVIQDYVGLSNEEILNSFRDFGFVLYDHTSIEDTNANGFDVYKLAGDVSVEDAAAAYDQGIDTLKPTEAARILSGSWRYLVSRPAKTEMRLRYFDFNATTATTAINDAVASQGFDPEGVSEMAEDTMGNINVTGTFEKNGVNYQYTISVCDLSQVYDIEGLPETAQYVGIKVTEQEA